MMDLDEQMQQLENRLNEKFNKRLESEISELNRKLDQVITRLNSPSGGASVTSSPHSTAPSAKSEAVASRSVKSTVSHFESTEDLSQLLKPRAIPSVTSNGSESVMTSNLLPIAAVICFVLAAIFIVKLAIDSGWLTPIRQWGLINFLGIALIGYALVGPYLEDAKYKSYLAGAGLVVLFVSALSSNLYFGLFSVDFSLVLVGIFSCLGIYLSQEFKEEIFLVVSSLGVYLAPVLVGDAKDLEFYSYYFALTSFAFSIISVKLNSRALALVSSYFAMGVYAFLSQKIQESSDIFVVIVVEVFQFFCFTLGSYFHSVISKSPLTKKMAMAFMPVLLFFYATVYFFLAKISDNVASFASIGFAAFLGLLYWKARQQLEHLNSDELVFGFMTIVLGHSGYFKLMPTDAKPWLLSVFLLSAVIMKEKDVFPSISKFLKKGIFIIGAIEYFSICFRLLDNQQDWAQILPAIFAVGLGFFYYSKNSRSLKQQETLFLGLVHALAVLALYRIAYPYGTLAVTGAWALYSILILSTSYSFKQKLLAKSSLLVLVLTGLKALIYDASQAASGLRILSLLLTGVLLFVAGSLLKKINALED